MADQEELYQRVADALDTIRPYLKADGGDISLIEITADKVLKVKLTGACKGCPMSMQTLKGGVEMVVKQAAPEIIEIESIEN